MHWRMERFCHELSFSDRKQFIISCIKLNMLHTEFIWRTLYICLLLLISMLWHRQAIFESKGDKLSSSVEGRIRTHQGLRHQIASRLNARWQTDWAIEDQAKKLELDSPSLWSASIQPTRPTAVWHSHLALAIYMFVVVNIAGHKYFFAMFTWILLSSCH